MAGNSPRFLQGTSFLPSFLIPTTTFSHCTENARGRALVEKPHDIILRLHRFPFVATFELFSSSRSAPGQYSTEFSATRTSCLAFLDRRPLPTRHML
ncbi:hypothetical protein ABKN59_006791 [Abortiporus biennis]